MEIKALKAILQVKKGTSNYLVYNELKRADIISKIKNRQYNFYHRILSIDEREALVKAFISLCSGTSIIKYYESLHNHRVTE